MRHGGQIPQDIISKSYFDHCKDRFGFMFPRLASNASNILPFDKKTLSALEQLGEAIGSKVSNNDSKIPAGYTYLGQFIDHDITLDVSSNIDKFHTVGEVKDLPNFRTPSFDLDSVYGRGPKVDPHLYINNSGDPNTDGIKLLLGTNKNTGSGGPSAGKIPKDFDVPRTSDFTSILGDPRNNENLIISQIHHAFLKFHNAVVDFLIKKKVPNNKLFYQAKICVTHHYQWVVLHDFLKTIAIPKIVDNAINDFYKFFRLKLIMPVEFSVAAFRFGHSMVRPEYVLNHDSRINPASMAQVFEFVRVNAPRGNNRLPVFSNWVVDLNRFFDTGKPPALNFAKQIDTALSPSLNTLPGLPPGFMAHLAKRNLKRGVALRVPYAQAITKTLGISTLSKSELLSNASQKETDALKKANLLDKTPLWYYILKEAELKQNGERLGTLGSIIVAQTFVRILQNNQKSILKTPFKPSLPRIKGKKSGGFDMADLLNFAGVL